MKKSHLFLSLLALYIVHFSLFITPVQAQTCTTQYGGATTCVTTDLSINKQVQYPTNTNLFVENLTEVDPPYAAGMEVQYRLQITNSTGQTLSQVTVRDVLPQYLTFVSGPGKYDTGSRTLTFTIDNLPTGLTNVNVLTKVLNTLPFEKNCEVENTITITGPGNRFNDDRTRICLAKTFAGVTQLPVAGFNDLALMIPFIATGLGGLALLRKRG